MLPQGLLPTSFNPTESPKLVPSVMLSVPMDLTLVGKGNQTFTDDELKIIRQSRLAAEESLQRVKAEISAQREELSRQIEKLNSQITELENQEGDLTDKIKRYSTALSPHNRVPPEILCRIFKYCVHENEVVEIPVTYKDGAYTISHVCSIWRHLALSTPELWVGVSLNITEENEQKVRIACEWLSRARTLPRSIVIKRDVGLDKCDGWGNDVILNLVAHYPLRSLELTLPLKQLKQLKGTLDQSMSTLEVIRLECSPQGNPMTLLVVPFLFHHGDILSRLYTLVLKGNWDLQYLDSVGSWSMIVCLDVDAEIPASQCFDILRRCSQIESCTLHVQETNTAFAVPDLVLPQITRLCIYTGGQTLKMLVDSLTAPRLANLAFRRQHNRQALSDLSTSALCQMVERCEGLKQLRAFHASTTLEPLNPMVLLDKLPYLETMCIDNGMLDEEAINHIAIGKVGSKLKSMEFRSRHDADDILRMVEVRHRNASINHGSRTRISTFSEITFHCISTPVKANFISRKVALESQGNIKITLIFV